MSELKVTTLQANLTTIGNTGNLRLGDSAQLSSAGLSFAGGNGVVNTTSIKVTSGGNSLTLQNQTTLASMNIAGKYVNRLFDETVNTQIFTANGTWTKPSWATTGNELVVVHMWGGGGGGNTSSGGGGGGAMIIGYYKASHLGSTANVVVGPGGLTGVPGGNSSFANSVDGKLIGYGGASWSGSLQNNGGGGWANTPTGSGPAGGPLGGANNGTDSTFGGGGGAGLTSNPGGSSIYGGGGGSGTGLTAGGSSIYGGGGGSISGVSGSSIYGGRGANSSVVAGIPGGGGGGTAAPNTTGARGEVRVYTYRKVTYSHGDFIQGGYFIGELSINNQVYGIILSPKASGHSTSLQWKTTNTASPGTESLVDGLTNTNNMDNANHPAAQFCAALTINGYTDWYFPARDELNLAWVNRLALPVSERNDSNSVTGDLYWSSTQSSIGETLGSLQAFETGNFSATGKNFNARVRAVRRVLIR